MLFNKTKKRDVPDTFYIDAKELPLFDGYILFLAFRWYCFAYWKHVTMCFRRIAFGNILQTLFSPVVLLVDMYKLTDTHVLESIQFELEAYRLLSSKE